MNAPDLLVLVLSYNGASDTDTCLASLAAQDQPHGLLVVDNASRDDTRPLLAAHWPETEVLALPENRGWAGGNNAGIALALERGYAWICLLNNDTVLLPGSLRALRDAAGRAGPCLLHPEIGYYDEPAVHQLATTTPGVGPEHPALPGLHRMDHAYGACLLVHAEVFRRIGLFDERFFLQCEEADLWRRAARAGYASLLAPAARILHRESRAFGTRRTPLKTYYTIRNTLLLERKHARGSGRRLAGLRRVAWTMLNLAGEAAPGRAGSWGGLARWLLSSNPHAVAARRGLGDYVRGRFGRAPSRVAGLGEGGQGGAL